MKPLYISITVILLHLVIPVLAQRQSNWSNQMTTSQVSVSWRWRQELPDQFIHELRFENKNPYAVEVNFKAAWTCPNGTKEVEAGQLITIEANAIKFGQGAGLFSYPCHYASTSNRAASIGGYEDLTVKPADWREKEAQKRQQEARQREQIAMRQREEASQREKQEAQERLKQEKTRQIETEAQRRKAMNQQGQTPQTEAERKVAELFPIRNECPNYYEFFRLEAELETLTNNNLLPGPDHAEKQQKAMRGLAAETTPFTSRCCQALASIGYPCKGSSTSNEPTPQTERTLAQTPETIRDQRNQVAQEQLLNNVNSLNSSDLIMNTNRAQNALEEVQNTSIDFKSRLQNTKPTLSPVTASTSPTTVSWTTSTDPSPANNTPHKPEESQRESIDQKSRTPEPSRQLASAAVNPTNRGNLTANHLMAFQNYQWVEHIVSKGTGDNPFAFLNETDKLLGGPTPRTQFLRTALCANAITRTIGAIETLSAKQLNESQADQLSSLLKRVIDTTERHLNRYFNLADPSDSRYEQAQLLQPKLALERANYTLLTTYARERKQYDEETKKLMLLREEYERKETRAEKGRFTLVMSSILIGSFALTAALIGSVTDDEQSFYNRIPLPGIGLSGVLITWNLIKKGREDKYLRLGNDMDRQIGIRKADVPTPKLEPKINVQFKLTPTGLVVNF